MSCYIKQPMYIFKVAESWLSAIRLQKGVKAAALLVWYCMLRIPGLVEKSEPKVKRNLWLN